MLLPGLLPVINHLSGNHQSNFYHHKLDFELWVARTIEHTLVGVWLLLFNIGFLVLGLATVFCFVFIVVQNSILSIIHSLFIHSTVGGICVVLSFGLLQIILL